MMYDLESGSVVSLIGLEATTESGHVSFTFGLSNE